MPLIFIDPQGEPHVFPSWETVRTLAETRNSEVNDFHVFAELEALKHNSGVSVVEVVELGIQLGEDYRTAADICAYDAGPFSFLTHSNRSAARGGCMIYEGEIDFDTP